MFALRVGTLLLAAAIYLSTHLPQGIAWGVVSVLGSLATATLWFLQSLRPSRRHAMLLVAVAAATFLVPPSPEPLWTVHPALPALAWLFALLAAAARPRTPVVESGGFAAWLPSVRTALWVAVPFIVIAGASAFGPRRISALMETQLVGPLLVAAALWLVVAVLHFVRIQGVESS